MDPTSMWKILVWGAIAIGVMILVVSLTHDESSASLQAAATIALVSGAAIGIERTIEGFWTVIGALRGTFWPLTSVAKQVDDLVKDLDDALASFHGTASASLTTTASSLADAQKALGRINEEQQQFRHSLASATRRIDSLKAGPRDNQRLQLLAATAAQRVSYVTALYEGTIPELGRAGRAANAAINGLQDFVATFKDNPGRRLVSLFLGVFLGLGIAGMLGLDVISASLEQAPSNPVAATVNVIVTGILIGLGSNPTHEVIRAIQEYKKGQKGENALLPDQPTSPGPGAASQRASANDTSTLASSQRIARLLRRLPDEPTRP